MGLRIKVGIPDAPPGPGIDTEDDLRNAHALMTSQARLFVLICTIIYPIRAIFTISIGQVILDNAVQLRPVFCYLVHAQAFQRMGVFQPGLGFMQVVIRLPVCLITCWFVVGDGDSNITRCIEPCLFLEVIDHG